MPDNIVIVNGVRVDPGHIEARIKDAVHEALEQAAKVAQNWGAESIAQNDPQDQHEKDIVFAQTLSALVISKGIRALKQE